MPVDKFGRMSDTKTKDTGVSLTYINNNYVRSDGGTPISGSIDMKGNTLYNGANPINPQDVATKDYTDNVKGGGWINRKQDGTYAIKRDLDIDGKRLLNIPPPVDDADAVNKIYTDTLYDETRRYVDNYVEKYVTDYVEKFKDENDFFTLPWDIDMAGKKIFSLPEPMQDDEPATKKYVDDLQIHYIDKKGNIKFNRNINVSNQRIFSLKDPKKPYEAANKKYVDDSINKRIEEEKDNFLPQDPATKQYVDEAIKGLAGGDVLVSKEGVFIKENGHYRATAPLDIDNQKMENLPEPEEDGDAVNKKYIDGVIESLTLKQGLIRENGGFNLVDSYINMNFNNIRNVGNPVHSADAVPKSFVDDVIETALGQVQNQFKQLNQLVSVSASCYEHLKKDDYQFTFGGPILNGKLNELDKFNGFLVPANGVIKHFTTFSTGLVHNLPPYTFSELFKRGVRNLIELYGEKDNPTTIFSLIKIENGGNEEIIGSVVFYLTDIKNLEGIRNKEKPYYTASPVFAFRPKQKYLNKEENFICSVNQGDIINIKSEYTENIRPKDEDLVNYKGVIDTLPVPFFSTHSKSDSFRFFLHTATLTFLFKEMSFPNILKSIPLDN